MRLSRALVVPAIAGVVALAGVGIAHADDIPDPYAECQAAAVVLADAQIALDAALKADAAVVAAQTADDALADAQAVLASAKASANAIIVSDLDTVGLRATILGQIDAAVAAEDAVAKSLAEQKLAALDAYLDAKADVAAKAEAAADDVEALQVEADKTDANGLRALRDEAKVARDAACATLPTSTTPTTSSSAPTSTTTSTSLPTGTTAPAVDPVNDPDVPLGPVATGV